MKGTTENKTKLWRTALLFILAFVFLCSSFANPQPVSALSSSDFKAGNIIDDYQFFNSSTMSSQLVQNFLNAKVPACDTNGSKMYDSIQTRAQYSATKGVSTPFTCLRDYSQNTPTMATDPGLCGQLTGAPRTAAQIIVDVGVACGVNPQTLIILLQKEQSLITDEWPWPVQYSSATGFGCPDTSPCDPSYGGFFYQVYYAARQFKVYVNNPGLFNYRAGRNNSIPYNPSAACGSSSIYLNNQATAGLYIYTPYQPNAAALSNLYGSGDNCSAYGNRNFWRMFADWFGPTTGTKIIKKDGDSNFYLYNNGQKIRIPSMALYYAYNFHLVGVTTVNASYLDSLPTGNNLTPLVKGADATVFLEAGGMRRALSGQNCIDWGLDCSNPFLVTTMDKEMLDVSKYVGPIQPLMRNNGVIYQMVGGYKLPLLNLDALTQNGFNFGQITEVEDMSAQNPVGKLIPSDGSSFKPLGSSAIYVYTQGNYWAVDTVATFYGWRLQTAYYPNPPSSLYDTTPPVPTATLKDSFLLSQSSDYLIDGGRKIAVTTNWPAPQPVTGVESLLNRLPTTTANVGACYRNDAGLIFIVESGKLRTIRTYDDAVRLGCTTGQMINLSTDSSNLLTKGPDYLLPGTPYKAVGSDVIAVANDNTTGWRVPDLSVFTSLGLVPQNVYSVDPVTNTAYSSNSWIPTAGYRSGSFYILSNRSVKYKGSLDVLNAWGVNTGGYSYVGIIGQTLDSTQTVPSSRFVRISDGTMYYGADGSKHKLLSYDAFVRLGGNAANLMSVHDDFIANIPTGNPVN